MDRRKLLDLQHMMLRYQAAAFSAPRNKSEESEIEQFKLNLRHSGNLFQLNRKRYFARSKFLTFHGNFRLATAAGIVDLNIN